MPFIVEWRGVKSTLRHIADFFFALSIWPVLIRLNGDRDERVLKKKENIHDGAKDHAVSLVR
jgi:hypothetical protein